MKHFLGLLLCGIFFTASAQHWQNQKTELYLTIRNNVGQPVMYQDLYLIEKETKEKLTGRTDKKGKANFRVIKNYHYEVYFTEGQKHSEIEINPGSAGFVIKTISYSPPNSVAVPENPTKPYTPERKPIGQDTIYQDLPPSAKPDRSLALVKLQVTDRKELPVKGIAVSLVHPKSKRTYIASTDQSGEVRFKVPQNTKYDIFFGNFKHHDQLVLPARIGLIMGGKLRYEPTNVEEIVKNDTIWQNLDEGAGPTSLRAFCHVLVSNLNGDPLPDEVVKISLKDNSKVYIDSTNQQGVARFLLPKGAQYIIHFQYERDVDLLDLSDDRGMQTLEIEYSYRGSKAIEAFYAQSGRNQDGFLTEFMESKVERTVIKKPDYLEITDQGFNIHMPSESHTPTPAIGENNLYISGGYYTDEFYAFDANTGKFKWGLELSDGGPSSAVYDNGVVLINTQSCTLYAIEAKTGRLLWSKWLGPNLYSTPTVANGKVYAVYPNKLTIRRADEAPKNFAMACFDLRTGAIQWQGWLDAEVLAAPVYAGGKVYVTTQLGRLYQFDSESGEVLFEKNLMATTPPTVVGNKVYLGVKASLTTNQEWVVLMDASNMQQSKRLTDLQGTLPVKTVVALSATHQMNYSGSRILHYEGRNYNVMQNKLICSNPSSGAIIWSKMLGQSEDDNEGGEVASMPVVAAAQILIAAPDGNLQFFDPATGKLNQSITTGQALYSQPAVHNGWIYSGTSKGKMVSVNTKDAAVTGWPMWGKSATHNTVVLSTSD